MLHTDNTTSCTDNCPSNLYIEYSDCLEGENCSPNLYEDLKICVEDDQCPPRTIQDIDNDSVCHFCHEQCVDTCEPFVYAHQCVRACPDQAPYIHDDTCYELCPPDSSRYINSTRCDAQCDGSVNHIQCGNESLCVPDFEQLQSQLFCFGDSTRCNFVTTSSDLWLGKYFVCKKGNVFTIVAQPWVLGFYGVWTLLTSVAAIIMIWVISVVCRRRPWAVEADMKLLLLQRTHNVSM